MTAIVQILLILMGSGGRPEQPDTAPYLQAVQSCASLTAAGSPQLRLCLPVHVNVALHHKKPCVSPDWLQAQFAAANKLFAPLGTCFGLEGISWLPPRFYHLKNRGDRDRLGEQKRLKSGVINVFVSGIVNNVDEKGTIYGVHWRWRKNKAKRWIILSAEAWPFTMVHEFGHYFGLPHCEYDGSIMNKTKENSVPIRERTFHPEELLVIEQGIARKQKSKELKPLLFPAPPEEPGPSKAELSTDVPETPAEEIPSIPLEP